MFDYKLAVLKRKFYKSVRETVKMINARRKEAKAVGKSGSVRRPLYWKLSRKTYFFRTTEETPAGRVFSAIYRCLNFSVAAIISPYPHASRIWKTVAPKAELQLRSVCAKTPPLSRGYTGKLPQGSETPEPPKEKKSEGVPPGVEDGLLEPAKAEPQTPKPFSLAMGSPAPLKEEPKVKDPPKNKPNQPSRNRPVEIAPKMNALLFDPVTLSLHYDRVNAPTKIYKDEVLVQVVYSGVSATDVFITEGKVHCGEDPVILGHEISGKVYAVGSDVHHVQKGDDVAVNAFSACCICRYCSRGLFSSCVREGLHSIGALRNGGWAQFVIVKKSQVHKIPEGLGLDRAALVQPLSCILCALPKLNIMYGTDVFIQGLGLSGCLWAALLHSRGHKNVIVTDKSEKKKSQFESLDLKYDFVPPEDIVKQSADVIIECAGSPNHIEKSFNIVNANGKLCFFGKPNPMLEVRCLPYDIIKKEITIVGNSGNAFCFTEALDVAAAMGPRYLDFDKLGVHTFDLRDYKEAFQLKKSGEATKIVFKLDS